MKHAPRPLIIQSGVLCLYGYGLRLAVERGHLIAEDGIAGERRIGRFARVGSGIRRVVVLGSSGTVSLDALRWLHETGAAFVQIAASGELIASGTPHALTDVRLRRAQAMSSVNTVGVDIARHLLREKLVGQARVLDNISGRRPVGELVQACAEQLEKAPSIDSLRFIESRAAAAYWSAWEDVPVHFAGRGAKQVPMHWRRFGTRRSLLTNGPRKATNPPNALLNYLYTIALAEARLAALAVGCDPALGVIHADRPNRDSLASDLMEPVRPTVDEHVLQLLATHTFQPSDFFETREGNCRLMPDVAAPLATTALRWRRALGPIAERVGGAFRRVAASATAMTPPVLPAPAAAVAFRTPLTGRNRSRPLTERAASMSALHLVRRCRDCGASLRGAKRTYCDDCLPTAARRASAKGVNVQRQLRAVGDDRRQSEASRRTLSDHAKRRAKERQDWEGKHPTLPSAQTFDSEILPLLTEIPDEVLAKASGLSRQAIKSIRRKRMRPHARHWDRLRAAAAHYRESHPPLPERFRDPGFFAREIAPFLPAIGAAGIQRATTLSKSYARRILHGHHIPDRRHWPALANEVAIAREAGASRGRMTRA